jgi:hypothetical protein
LSTILRHLGARGFGFPANSMKIGRLYLSNVLASSMQLYGTTAVDGEEPDRQKKEDKTRKSYKAIVVAVVMAAGTAIGTAGVALADSEGAGFKGTTNPSEWTSLGSASGSAAVQAESVQARGPVETGALSARTVKSEDGQWLNMDVGQQNSSPQLRGRPNIQSGP